MNYLITAIGVLIAIHFFGYKSKGGKK